MNLSLKKLSLSAMLLAFITFTVAAHDDMLEITFTNITKSLNLTPPIFATSKKNDKISLFELGKPASAALEQIAEGGATDDLAALLRDQGAEVIQTAVLVKPGESITVMIEGKKKSNVYAASMLLPTNDGFVALNGVQMSDKSTFLLRSYDAGTEENDESCVNIPGPTCGGEGFNEADGEGYVFPHPTTHGDGTDLSREDFGWSGPAAIITIKQIRND